MIGPARPRPLRLAVVLATSASLLAAAGCVSRAQHDGTVAELATCEDEKAMLEAANIAWEQRYDAASTRWQEIGDHVQDAVPKALAEFHEERDRILEIVPTQVQSEVAAYLEDYFATVSQGFQMLREDNENIRIQLETTNRVLETLGADTSSISASVGETLAEERTRRQNERRRNEALAAEVASVVERIAAFDSDRIDCKGCPDRLTLTRKERETILAFHREITTSLTRARTGDVEAEASEEAAAGPGEGSP